MQSVRLKPRYFIVLFSKLGFLALQICMYAYVWYHEYMNLMPIHYYRRGNWAVIGVYAVVLLVFNRALESLKIGYLKKRDILYSQTLTVIATNGFTYVFLVLLNGKWAIFKGFTPYFQHIGPILRMTGLQLVLVVIWTIGMSLIYAWLYPPQQLVLIYDEISPDILIRKLKLRDDKFHVKYRFRYREDFADKLEELSDFDSVLIGDIRSQKRNAVLKYCFQHNIRCYGMPKLSDIIIRSAEDVELFDTPLLLFQNYGLDVYQRFAKRIMDIVISLLAILLTGIPMLLIAAAIHFYDNGPVFYRQKRLTKDGREFNIIKFRSMIEASEENGARLAKKNDDRITPVGNILRRTHLDELPQLFNILEGDMSVVGPRPEREEIAREYGQSIPEFSFRLKVKAGLTGYAQVYGQYNTTPYDKLRLDLKYIENYSLWLDIKLMIFTIKILFRKEKSEGVDDQKKTAL